MPYVASDHPADCAELCCWEIRLTEMHDTFDWRTREREMALHLNRNKKRNPS